MASKKCDGLYKRGRYYWASRDPVTGKALSSKCTDLEAARMWLKERERIHANPQYKASRSATLGDWSSKFFAAKKSKPSATQNYYEYKIRAILSVFPPNTALSSIDAGAVDEYVAARLRAPTHPTEVTVMREVRVMIAILTKAKRKGCYTGDLEELVPDIDGSYKPRQRALTPEEFVAFWHALPSDRWKAFAAVCLALGCRSSEAARLTRDDVELDAGLVWIDGRKTSSSNRTLPILSPYRALLESALPALPFGKVANVHRTFGEAARKAGILPLSPNDLRRSHATLNSIMGLPDDMIARLLGHTSVSMTKRTYNRAKAAQLAPVAERLLEGNTITFGLNTLQSDDTARAEPQKPAENVDYHRTAHPDVSSSNPTELASNHEGIAAQTRTDEHRESQPCPGKTTILRQSDVPRCGTCKHFVESVHPNWCLGAYIGIGETDYCSQHPDAVAARKGGAL
jgi:integrase